MRRHRQPALVAACLAAGLLAPALCLAADTFTADLSPAASQGSGHLTATLDTQTRELAYTLTWSGLTGPATMAHFHGPAPAGANAGVALPLGNDPASPIKGQATLTDEQVQALESGQWYANVHTAKNKGGEIRGQVIKGS